jgi:beta-lactamase class A
MVKASSNESASRFSRQLGLRQIQEVINSYGLYDREHGGGIWLGKHYGQSEERMTDPVGGYSHGATVRQVLRFFLLLEQGRLVSPEASAAMRKIFESPEIPHDRHKFVLGLSDRPVTVIRKWGSWEEWLHDAAVVKGPGRHYILVGLTRHRNGDSYLAALAREIDDLLAQ